MHPEGPEKEKGHPNARTLNPLPVLSLDANSPGEDVTLSKAMFYRATDPEVTGN